MAAARESDRILERLSRLYPKKIDLSLGRILTLLDGLDRPQDRLPPVVRVAGTNGKGSVIAFMRTSLEAAGHQVHVYTSPHLVSFSERIRLAGAPIAEPELRDALEECERANGDAPITFFEITTAAAIHAFAKHPADIVLMECGLGGRWDATAVVPTPALTAITPISMDHMEFLGDSLEKIAAEKAAIQNPAAPSVVGPQDPVAMAVIVAKSGGAPLHRFGVEWTVRSADDGMLYQSKTRELRLPAPKLTGPHQILNAGTAVACLENIAGLSVPEDALAQGTAGADWPARLQRLEAGNLVRLLPPGWRLWLDGGHNAAAGAVLAQAIAAWGERPLHLVAGLLSSKEPRGFLEPLAACADSLRAVAIPGESASLPADAVADSAHRLGIAATPAASVREALEEIVEAHGKAHGKTHGVNTSPGDVLICGSLYLAGHVLRENGWTVRRSDSQADR